MSRLRRCFAILALAVLVGLLAPATEAKQFVGREASVLGAKSGPLSSMSGPLNSIIQTIGQVRAAL